ncbi:unnamed protein product, partial [Mesorhabditis spiculigera]
MANTGANAHDDMLQTRNGTSDDTEPSPTLFAGSHTRIRRDNGFKKPECDLRPFLCYAHEHQHPADEGVGMPGWLKSLCPHECPVRLCGADATGKAGNPRLLMMSPCRPKFCATDADEASGAPDCIRAATINDGKDKVLFPFNLCTREMIAADRCPGTAWTTAAYARNGQHVTNKYLAQCDAGFVIPEIVLDAITKHGTARDPPLKTCVPSLHIAAGYATDDPSPFTNYPYDVHDPLNFKYCGKGGRPPGDTCEPLPICKKDGTSPDSMTQEVIEASDCDNECDYRYGATQEGCVYLDISNPGGTIPYFTARRALSGPYAVFMDEEETLMLGAVEEEPASTPKGRTIVVGDIHGNFDDLWHIIHAWLSDAVGKGPGQNIIFLGNIVGAGARLLECLTLILAYKVLVPDKVSIILGNHELDAETGTILQDHLAGRGYSPEVIEEFTKLFAQLPLMGLIDGRILCVHGLITFELNKTYLDEGWGSEDQFRIHMRRGLTCNDPSDLVDYSELHTDDARYSRLGRTAIKEAMQRLGIEFIIRGKQVMMNGVQRFRDLPVATVFSSSCYKENNLGAILFVDPEKNAITPVFFVNINEKIQTQKELDEKLAKGWMRDGYYHPMTHQRG